MDDKLRRLVEAGFVSAGRWLLSGETMSFSLDTLVMHKQNVLYAFAVDNQLVYVGKTTQSLLKRMHAYRSPAKTAERGGSTNIKNNSNIFAALSAGAAVDILVLHSLPEQKHGEFDVNLSAGLEDSLIKALAPPWNGKTQIVSTTEKSGAIRAVLGSPSGAQLQQLHESGRLSAMPRAADLVLPEFPSSETLLAYCKSKEGEKLVTLARGNPFTIEIVGAYLEITPGTSRTPRREPTANIDAVLARLSQNLSFKMSDYQDISFNASYLLALVKLWQHESATEAQNCRQD